MDTVPGFTARQRQWFIGRDNNQCTFHIWKSGVWVRCKNTPKQISLDVHHIVPRGWSLYHLGKGFAVNGPMNGITLCKIHHRGYQFGDGTYIIHPDTEVARLSYATNKDSFNKMTEDRRLLNEKGIPYWNTNWDWMFQRWVKRHTLSYIVGHPYPDNQRRSRNGSLLEKMGW